MQPKVICRILNNTGNCTREVLESAIFRQNFICLTPAFEVVDNWVATTSSYDPNDILIAVVDFLVLGISGYESEVSWCKLLSLRAVRTTHNGAMPACSVDDGVCVAC